MVGTRRGAPLVVALLAVGSVGAAPARTTDDQSETAPTAPAGDVQRDPNGSRLPWVLGALAVVVVLAGGALLARRRRLTPR